MQNIKNLTDHYKTAIEKGQREEIKKIDKNMHEFYERKYFLQREEISEKYSKGSKKLGAFNKIKSHHFI
jgi:uncharacterized protein YeeX (DUF496 family)